MLTDRIISALDTLQNKLEMGSNNLAYAFAANDVVLDCRSSCYGSCDGDCAGGCSYSCAGSCNDSNSGSSDGDEW